MSQQSNLEMQRVFAQLSPDEKANLLNIHIEMQRAEKKHPVWPTDLIHRAAIVAEESGELTKATIQYEYENGLFDELYKEALQTAAMALRFIKNLPISFQYNGK